VNIRTVPAGSEERAFSAFMVAIMLKKLTHSAVLICLGALLAAGLAGTGGCGSRVGRADARDREDATVRRALAKQDAGQKDEAIALYREAVADNPRLARAHLDLALLLHERNRGYEDGAAAIYHYRRYLDLQPETEKREMIEDRIRLAGQELSAQFVRTRDKTPEAFTELEQENAALRQKVAELENEKDRLKALAAATPAATVAVTSTPPANSAAPARVVPAVTPTSPAAAPGKPRSYKVAYGDTLSGIATEMYGDARKWRKIYDANKVALGSSQALKVGQVLTIPE